MKILVACEESGTVRDAFIKRGHNAISCDVLPSRTEGPHIQGDVIPHLSEGWDMIVAFPPCTYLSSSGLHWNSRIPGRAEKTEEALRFVKAIWEAPCPRVAIENPVGAVRRILGAATQWVQPHEYGHNASKKTGLWLRGLPPLVATGPHIPPRMVNGRPRWNNQCDSGQNHLGPSPTRAQERSKTYTGIAEAMAAQWS